MKFVHCIALVTLLFAPIDSLATLQVSRSGDEIPVYTVADPNAPLITVENLLDRERFWPYHASLTKAWKPSGMKRELRAKTYGVLIRVESTGIARIDFGRDGLHNVPIGVTDLVERANEIRTGRETKMAPNFILALGTKLVDSAAETIRPFNYSSVAGYKYYLCVFADPMADSFPEIVLAMDAFRNRKDILIMFFPQGEHSDHRVRHQLREHDWKVPFVFEHLSVPYTKTLLFKEAPRPTVLLQSPEGRMLFQSGWRSKILSDLVRAMDISKTRQ